MILVYKLNVHLFPARIKQLWTAFATSSKRWVFGSGFQGLQLMSVLGYLMESWKDKNFDQISHVIPGMRWNLGSIRWLLSVRQPYCCSIGVYWCGYLSFFCAILNRGYYRCYWLLIGQIYCAPLWSLYNKLTSWWARMVTCTRAKCTAQMIQECLVPLYLFLTIVFHLTGFFRFFSLSFSNQENNFVGLVVQQCN